RGHLRLGAGAVPHLDLAAENLDVGVVARGGDRGLGADDGNAAGRGGEPGVGRAAEGRHARHARAGLERGGGRALADLRRAAPVGEDAGAVVEADARARARMGDDVPTRLDLLALGERHLLAVQEARGHAAGLVRAATHDLADLAVPRAVRRGARALLPVGDL